MQSKKIKWQLLKLDPAMEIVAFVKAK